MLNPEQTALETIARNAGELIRTGFGKARHIQHKSRLDLVTEYDRAVEDQLREQLEKQFPGVRLIAEESADLDGWSIAATDAIYIDPIDGTTNFVHGFPFTAISIGAWQGASGIWGLVYNPILDECYWAERGKGAQLNHQRIQASQVHTLADALGATGFPPGMADRERQLALQATEAVIQHTRGIRRAGSAALDLCLVARGTCDFYWEWTLKPWDIAAGALIAREAGALVRGQDGPLGVLDGRFTLASAPGIATEVETLFDESFDRLRNHSGTT